MLFSGHVMVVAEEVKESVVPYRRLILARQKNLGRRELVTLRPHPQEGGTSLVLMPAGKEESLIFRCIGTGRFPPHPLPQWMRPAAMHNWTAIIELNELKWQRKKEDIRKKLIVYLTTKTIDQIKLGMMEECPQPYDL